MGEHSWYCCWHDIGAIKVSFKTDLEIACAAKKRPIFKIGKSLNIPAAELVPFGHDKARVSQSFINSVQDQPNGKLILVTAINPTPAGEIMTMPGLPRTPAAETICVNKNGEIEGLF